MASIRTLKATNTLFIDFRYQGKRCREYTKLDDTPANRKKLTKTVQRLDAELAAGTFDYDRFFPDSRKGARSKGATVLEVPSVEMSAPVALATTVAPVMAVAPNRPATPDFASFTDTWMIENGVMWRRTYRRTVEDIVRKYFLPRFAEREVGSFTRAELLQLRAELAKVPGRKKETLSPRRINAVMNILSLILKEASDRYQFTCPYYNIKPLKIPKSEVQPFTLEEVRLILAKVRVDFRNYFAVRFFTGLRTGEIDGLKWEYVDFERSLILVRETRVMGEQEDEAKTTESIRDIQCSQVVMDALREQFKATGRLRGFVFCARDGTPLDHNNVTKRVWYPLLRHLGLKLRRPYQTRHTAATLWLAAGENPEWIARQMGHTSTEMLFKVYSRYVPNLTRRDGSAFERLLTQSMAQTSEKPTDGSDATRRKTDGPDSWIDATAKESGDE